MLGSFQVVRFRGRECPRQIPRVRWAAPDGLRHKGVENVQIGDKAVTNGSAAGPRIQRLAGLRSWHEPAQDVGLSFP